jgi:GNAT superfamily N-acetyltransferase
MNLICKTRRVSLHPSTLITRHFSSRHNRTAQMSEYIIREGTQVDAEQLVEVGNAAFMADTFFKKPEFHLRFTQPRVVNMIGEENSVFLVAKRDNTNEILGSIYLHWEYHRDDKEDSINKVVGKFSAVSVPPKNEKRGIGKALVKAAENKILAIANSIGDQVKADLEMGVINQRKDLFPWYENQGFKTYEEIFDAEVDHIVLDDLRGKVFCVLMRKHLR